MEIYLVKTDDESVQNSIRIDNEDDSRDAISTILSERLDHLTSEFYADELLQNFTNQMKNILEFNDRVINDDNDEQLLKDVIDWVNDEIEFTTYEYRLVETV